MQMTGGKSVGLGLAMAGLVLALIAGGSTLMAGEGSLYERLGSKPAIAAVVDQFVTNIAADDRISRRWAEADVPTLKENLVDLICEAAGGPCVYTGQSMSMAHSDMNVTNDEFDWTANNLAAALDKLKVPVKEKEELLALIGSLRGQIVGK